MLLSFINKYECVHSLPYEKGKSDKLNMIDTLNRTIHAEAPDILLMLVASNVNIKANMLEREIYQIAIVSDKTLTCFQLCQYYPEQKQLTIF